jgi:N-acetylmuramoyl-L-alanine amidase-like protein
MSPPLSRRDMLRNAAAGAAALILPGMLAARPNGEPAARPADPDLERLLEWTAALRDAGLSSAVSPLGRSAVRVGELAAGTPYEPSTLEAYLRAGGSPSGNEPLTLSLTHFDCVTLVESCLAIARVAGEHGAPTWERFAREIERMRYRGGERRGYASRLHYFSEWIADGARRGLLRDIGAELGGLEDRRPLRFMTRHRASYPAFTDDGAFREIESIERRLDGRPRRVIPTARIPEVADRIQSGDVLAFATAIPGLDVTHTAFAYRDAAGVLRVLHAPLSGGVVEVTRATLAEYVAAIRRATGIMVARPLRG